MNQIESSCIEQIRKEVIKEFTRDVGGNSQEWINGYKCAFGEVLQIIDECEKQCKGED